MLLAVGLSSFSHEEVGPVSFPLRVWTGLMTCFGQWNEVKVTMCLFRLRPQEVLLVSAVSQNPCEQAQAGLLLRGETMWMGAQQSQPTSS